MSACVQSFYNADLHHASKLGNYSIVKVVSTGFCTGAYKGFEVSVLLAEGLTDL